MAIVVDIAHAAWTIAHITDILPMDIQAAFSHMSKGKVVNLLQVRLLYGDRIRWVVIFPSEKTFQMICKGNAAERHQVIARVPQGSPVLLIFFAITTSGVIKWVKVYVSAAEWPWFVDALGCVHPGRVVSQVVVIFGRCKSRARSG